MLHARPHIFFAIEVVQKSDRRKTALGMNEGVFLRLTAGEKEVVPQAVLKMVYDKWESQDL